MPVWVACKGYLESALQVSLNKVARTVTRLDRYTPTTVLMQQCGWMTVKQLKVFHSLVLLQKTLKHQTPSYLYRKVTSGTQGYATRQAAAQAAADLAAGVTTHPSVDSSELDLCRSCWAWVSVHWYRQLPPSIRAEKKIDKFKTALKTWVVQNIVSD